MITGTPATRPPAAIDAASVRKRSSDDGRAVVLVATRASELPIYPARPFTFVATHTTNDALAFIAHGAPDIVAVDWGAPGVDGAVVCRAAVRVARTLVLATPAEAATALKAGCHELLLRPFTTSLFATRVGRMLREAGNGLGDGYSRDGLGGSRRAWPDRACTRCDAPGAVSFEFASHRRLWFACLACNHTWIGAGQEEHL